MTSKNLPLLLIVAGAALLGGGLFLWGGGGPEELPELVVDPARTGRTEETPTVEWGDPGPARLAEPAPPDRHDHEETTVGYPLEIRLQLLEAKYDPQREGVPRKGTGANARIAGLIRGEGEKGLSATVTFVAGANAGRVLHSDRTGAFGASDLYPGLALTRIEAPGYVAEREISLRQAQVLPLNVSFHRTTSLTGEVLDAQGAAIGGARVRIDGQETTSDADGVFHFPRMTPGKLYVQVDKEGFASHRENLPLAGGKTIERGQVKFVLEPGCSLRINVQERVGSRGDALLYFLPAVARGRDRTFPWHELNPTRVVPGGSVLIEDLPAERVNLWLFHTGAVAAPSAVAVRLRPGVETTKTLHLEPAPKLSGVVKVDGEPVRGARVHCEAPDRLSATLAQFGEGPGFFDVALLPPFPVAREEVFTDDAGRFSVTAWPNRAANYLTAWSPDGTRTACELVTEDDLAKQAEGGGIVLDLEPLDAGDSTVEVAMPDRFQGLPVKVWVNGAPREPFVLPHDRQLEIGGLGDGAWSFEARWNSIDLAHVERFELDRDYRISLHLPEGAILGQTDDELKRAGRR